MGFCLPLLPPTKIPNNISDVEFKMPDCNECVRAMADIIPKFKGVESCVTDTENQKIVVTGSFNQEKLFKKIMKVIGHEVEIVTKEDKNKLGLLLEKEKELEKDEKIIDPNSDEHKEMEKQMMIAEENANAKCCIS